MISQDELWPRLEEKGEEEVQKDLNEGRYGRDKKPLVEAWLKTKQQKRTEAMAGRQETREDQSMVLSKEANAIARSANAVSHRSNVIAYWALGAAVAGFLISLIALLR